MYLDYSITLQINVIHKTSSRHVNDSHESVRKFVAYSEISIKRDHRDQW